MAIFMRQEQIARIIEEEEYGVGTASTYPSLPPYPFCRRILTKDQLFLGNLAVIMLAFVLVLYATS